MGPVDPSCELVQRLTADRRPDLLTLSMQTASTFPQFAAGCQLFEVETVADDHIITLPAKPEEYLLRLGKQTRKHLPYYVRRLQREWAGEYAFNVVQGDDITWDSFTAVLELNRLRMRSKRRLSLLSAASAKHRWPLVRSNGVIVSLRRGDTIVGATLSLLHRKEAYLIVIAHDPQYDQLNLGNVCLWKTVEHMISFGHTALHLLWGPSFYKNQFGGRQELLRNVSYAANSRAAALGRCLRLVARCNPVPFWKRAQRRLAGYIGSMRSPQHDDAQ
jgi:CelD/BcsL family acetyltransferase involved in cellulose biosynthesis